MDHFMSQQVLESTREKKYLRSSDNNKQGVDKKSHLQVGEPFSDHNSIVFEVNISSSKYPSRKKVYKFTKANLD